MPPSLEELLALNEQPDVPAPEPVAAPQAPSSLDALLALNEQPDEAPVAAAPAGPAYDTSGRIYVRDKWGELGTLAPEEITDQTPLASREEVLREEERKSNQTLLGGVQTFTEQAVDSATLGGAGYIARKLAPEYATSAEHRAEDLPIVAGAGQLTGAIGPALATGGLSTAESGAGLLAKGLRYAPTAVLERQASRVAAPVAKYFGGGTGARIASHAAAGALEGGVGDAAMAATAGQDPLEVLKSFGRGAAAGGVLSGGLSAVGEGIGKAGKKVDDFADGLENQRIATQAQQEIDALHASDVVPPDVMAENLIVSPGDELLGTSALAQIDNEVSPLVREIDTEATRLADKTVKDITDNIPKLHEDNAQAYISDLSKNADLTAAERLGKNPVDKLQALKAASGDLDTELDDIAREIETRRNRMHDAIDHVDTYNGVSAKLEHVVELTQHAVKADATSITNEISKLKNNISNYRADYGDAALAQDGGLMALRRVEKQIEHSAPKIADHLAKGNIAKAYGELDQLKRVTQRTGKKTRNREVQTLLREESEKFKDYLMDRNEWGPVADLQAEFNRPWSQRFLKGGDSDIQGLTKSQSGDRAIDQFETADRVNGSAMRGFLEGLGSQKTETAERAFRNQLAADADDLFTRAHLVGDPASKKIALQAAEDAIAIDALSTRFAEINGMKEPGARLQKLDADTARIAEAEAKDAARQSALEAKDVARQSKEEARLAKQEQREADRALREEARDQSRAAREQTMLDREAARDLEQTRKDKEDALSSIGALIGGAVGGAPGYIIGQLTGKVPKIIAQGKRLLQSVDAETQEKVAKSVSKLLSGTKRGVDRAASVAPLATVGFSQKKHDEKVSAALELQDSNSPAFKRLVRTANQLDVIQPGLGSAYAAKQKAIADFIASKLPPEMAQGIYGTRPPMDPITERNTKRYVQAAHEPIKALQRLAEGKGTTQDLETVKTLYPGLYRNFQKRVETELRQSKKKPDYDTRVRIQYATGLDLDGTDMGKLQQTADGNAVDAVEEVQGDKPQPINYQPSNDPNAVYGARSDQVIDRG